MLSHVMCALHWGILHIPTHGKIMALDDEIVCRCKRFEVMSKAQRFLTVSDYNIRLYSENGMFSTLTDIMMHVG